MTLLVLRYIGRKLDKCFNNIMEFKLFSKCETCRKRRLYIAKRNVTIPVGIIVKSKKLMCGHCYKAILQGLKTNKNEQTNS